MPWSQKKSTSVLKNSPSHFAVFFIAQKEPRVWFNKKPPSKVSKHFESGLKQLQPKVWVWPPSTFRALKCWQLQPCIASGLEIMLFAHKKWCKNGQKRRNCFKFCPILSWFPHPNLIFSIVFCLARGEGWSQIPFPQNKKTPAKLRMLGHWHRRRFVKVKGLPLCCFYCLFEPPKPGKLCKSSTCEVSCCRSHDVIMMWFCHVQKKHHRIFPTIFSSTKRGGVKSLCLSQTLWQVHPRNSTNRYHKNGHP